MEPENTSVDVQPNLEPSDKNTVSSTPTTPTPNIILRSDIRKPARFRDKKTQLLSSDPSVLCV